MRVELDIRDGKVYKSFETAPVVVEAIITNIGSYNSALNDVGFSTPETTVENISGSTITLSQPLIESGLSTDDNSIVRSLKSFDYSEFGIDSNPGNFMGTDKPIFIDYFPFLMRNDELIAAQFDYDPAQAEQRYFTVENVVTFYIVRLFLHDIQRAQSALSRESAFLQASWQSILPREKVRLLNAMELSQVSSPNFSSEYKSLYTNTKAVYEINPIIDDRALSLLQNISI